MALPLVLPPTVLGFYLLLALGPNGPGGWIARLGGGRSFAFTFERLVTGSVIYSRRSMASRQSSALMVVERPAGEELVALSRAYSGSWQTASRLWPSGSSTNAP